MTTTAILALVKSMRIAQERAHMHFATVHGDEGDKAWREEAERLTREVDAELGILPADKVRN